MLANERNLRIPKIEFSAYWIIFLRSVPRSQKQFPREKFFFCGNDEVVSYGLRYVYVYICICKINRLWARTPSEFVMNFSLHITCVKWKELRNRINQIKLKIKIRNYWLIILDNILIRDLFNTAQFVLSY